MKKRFLTFLAALLIPTLIVGCSGSAAKNEGDAKQAPAADQKTVLKIGATQLPHAEILEFIKPNLAKEGIDLQVTVFNDFVKPNLAVNDKELDANFFQHIPYLETFIKDRKMNLAAFTKVHIEPMGVYSKKIKSLSELPEKSEVSIPNDATNGGRALHLLAKAGLFKLKEGVGVTATPRDIVENPKNLKIREIEAAMLPRTMEDVTISVINTNYALQANLVPTKDALFMEDSDSPFVNIVAIRKGEENNPALQKLNQALTSPEVKKFIEDKYKGAVVPAF